MKTLLIYDAKEQLLSNKILAWLPTQQLGMAVRCVSTMEDLTKYAASDEFVLVLAYNDDLFNDIGVALKNANMGNKKVMFCCMFREKKKLEIVARDQGLHVEFYTSFINGVTISAWLQAMIAKIAS